MLAICWFDLKHFSEIRLKLSQQSGQPLKTIQSILCKTAQLIFYNAAFFLGGKQIQAVFRQSLYTIFGLNSLPFICSKDSFGQVRPACDEDLKLKGISTATT